MVCKFLVFIGLKSWSQNKKHRYIFQPTRIMSFNNRRNYKSANLRENFGETLKRKKKNKTKLEFKIMIQHQVKIDSLETFYQI